jgi:hypothetical protein
MLRLALPLPDPPAFLPPQHRLNRYRYPGKGIVSRDFVSLLTVDNPEHVLYGTAGKNDREIIFLRGFYQVHYNGINYEWFNLQNYCHFRLNFSVQ